MAPELLEKSVLRPTPTTFPSPQNLDAGERSASPIVQSRQRRAADLFDHIVASGIDISSFPGADSLTRAPNGNSSTRLLASLFGQSDLTLGGTAPGRINQSTHFDPATVLGRGFGITGGELPVEQTQTNAGRLTSGPRQEASAAMVPLNWTDASSHLLGTAMSLPLDSAGINRPLAGNQFFQVVAQDGAIVEPTNNNSARERNRRGRDGRQTPHQRAQNTDRSIVPPSGEANHDVEGRQPHEAVAQPTNRRSTNTGRSPIDPVSNATEHAAVVTQYNDGLTPVYFVEPPTEAAPHNQTANQVGAFGSLQSGRGGQSGDLSPVEQPAPVPALQRAGSRASQVHPRGPSGEFPPLEQPSPAPQVPPHHQPPDSQVSQGGLRGLSGDLPPVEQPAPGSASPGQPTDSRASQIRPRGLSGDLPPLEQPAPLVTPPTSAAPAEFVRAAHTPRIQNVVSPSPAPTEVPPQPADSVHTRVTPRGRSGDVPAPPVVPLEPNNAPGTPPLQSNRGLTADVHPVQIGNQTIENTQYQVSSITQGGLVHLRAEPRGRSGDVLPATQIIDQSFPASQATPPSSPGQDGDLHPLQSGPRRQSGVPYPLEPPAPGSASPGQPTDSRASQVHPRGLSGNLPLLEQPAPLVTPPTSAAPAEFVRAAHTPRIQNVVSPSPAPTEVPPQPADSVHTRVTPRGRSGDVPAPPVVPLERNNAPGTPPLHTNRGLTADVHPVQIGNQTIENTQYQVSSITQGELVHLRAEPRGRSGDLLPATPIIDQSSPASQATSPASPGQDGDLYSLQSGPRRPSGVLYPLEQPAPGSASPGQPADSRVSQVRPRGLSGDLPPVEQPAPAPLHTQLGTQFGEALLNRTGNSHTGRAPGQTDASAHVRESLRPPNRGSLAEIERAEVHTRGSIGNPSPFQDNSPELRPPGRRGGSNGNPTEGINNGSPVRLTPPPLREIRSPSPGPGTAPDAQETRPSVQQFRDHLERASWTPRSEVVTRAIQGVGLGLAGSVPLEMQTEHLHARTNPTVIRPSPIQPLPTRDNHPAPQTIGPTSRHLGGNGDPAPVVRLGDPAFVRPSLNHDNQEANHQQATLRPSQNTPSIMQAGGDAVTDLTGMIRRAAPPPAILPALQPVPPNETPAILPTQSISRHGDRPDVSTNQDQRILQNLLGQQPDRAPLAAPPPTRTDLLERLVRPATQPFGQQFFGPSDQRVRPAETVRIDDNRIFTNNELPALDTPLRRVAQQLEHLSPGQESRRIEQLVTDTFARLESALPPALRRQDTAHIPPTDGQRAPTERPEYVAPHPVVQSRPDVVVTTRQHHDTADGARDRQLYIPPLTTSSQPPNIDRTDRTTTDVVDRTERTDRRPEIVVERSGQQRVEPLERTLDTTRLVAYEEPRRSLPSADNGWRPTPDLHGWRQTAQSEPGWRPSTTSEISRPPESTDGRRVAFNGFVVGPGSDARSQLTSQQFVDAGARTNLTARLRDTTGAMYSQDATDVLRALGRTAEGNRTPTSRAANDTSSKSGRKTDVIGNAEIVKASKQEVTGEVRTGRIFGTRIDQIDHVRHFVLPGVKGIDATKLADRLVRFDDQKGIRAGDYTIQGAPFTVRTTKGDPQIVRTEAPNGSNVDQSIRPGFLPGTVRDGTTSGTKSSDGRLPNLHVTEKGGGKLEPGTKHGIKDPRGEFDSGTTIKDIRNGALRDLEPVKPGSKHIQDGKIRDQEPGKGTIKGVRDGSVRDLEPGKNAPSDLRDGRVRDLEPGKPGQRDQRDGRVRDLEPGKAGPKDLRDGRVRELEPGRPGANDPRDSKERDFDGKDARNNRNDANKPRQPANNGGSNQAVQPIVGRGYTGKSLKDLEEDEESLNQEWNDADIDMSEWLMSRSEQTSYELPSIRNVIGIGELLKLIDKNSEDQSESDSTSTQAKTAPQHRTKYIVKYGDSLESIAKAKFGDVRFATLILTINRANIQIVQANGRQIAALQPDQAIWLPTSEEVEIHRKNYFGSKNKTTLPPPQSEQTPILLNVCSGESSRDHGPVRTELVAGDADCDTLEDFAADLPAISIDDPGEQTVPAPPCTPGARNHDVNPSDTTLVDPANQRRARTIPAFDQMITAAAMAHSDEITVVNPNNLRSAKQSPAFKQSVREKPGSPDSVDAQNNDQLVPTGYLAATLHRIRCLGRKPVVLEMAPEQICQRRCYQVRLGETLQSVALRDPLMNDVRLWKLLAHINGLAIDVDRNGKPIAALQRGQFLVLPNEQEIAEFKLLNKMAMVSSEVQVSWNKKPTDAITTPEFETQALSAVCRIVSYNSEDNFSIQLECRVSEHWTPVASYESSSGHTSRSVYKRNGAKSNLKIDLPTEVAKQLAFEDFRRNWSLYYHNHLSEQSNDTACLNSAQLKERRST